MHQYYCFPEFNNKNITLASEMWTFLHICKFCDHLRSEMILVPV